MKKIKSLIIWITILLGGIIIFRIVQKTLQRQEAGKKIIYDVKVEKLKKQNINEYIKFDGILEGDPQVKVYPTVPGKFYKNIVSEGDYIRKDDTILLINRDVIGFKYKPARIKSPINGIVIKLYYIDKGSSINPQFPVAEIANTRNVKVILSAGYDELKEIKKGMSAYIYSPFSKENFIKGKVFSVTPFIDKDTLAGRIVVKAKNTKNLIPGMTVKVKVNTGEKEGFLVPSPAVLMGENETYIFINENNIAKKINVKLGYQQDGKVEIYSDKLKEGEEVIVEGAFKLENNSKINIIK